MNIKRWVLSLRVGDGVRIRVRVRVRNRAGDGVRVGVRIRGNPLGLVRESYLTGNQRWLGGGVEIRSRVGAWSYE